MNNYRLKKANPPALAYDRSFYDRFNRAWNAKAGQSPRGIAQTQELKP